MNTQLGRVSSVFVDENRNKIFVSVVTGPGSEKRDIPFSTPKPSLWLVPEEGDIVEVYQVDREWVARFTHNSGAQSIPSGLQEGDVCLKLDDSTEIRFQKSGGQYDVKIEASGDLILGDVQEAVSAAIQDHTHEYSWSDAAGSGTTGTPDQPGTDTRIS